MTIKDLAAMTGYSVGTVSRALNNHPSVSREARRVVLAAAEECGFQFNANAKQLKQQRLMSIQVIVKGDANQLFGELFEAIQSALSKTKYAMQLDYIEEDGNEVRRAIQLCRERKPMGIIFLGGNHRHFLADFKKIDIPCVLVTNDASGLNFANLSSVCVDDRLASRKVVEELIALGHREFVIVGGDWMVSDTSRCRYEGCMDAFRAHNIAFDPEKAYRPVRFSYQEGYAATQKLLESGQHFTALVAVADVMAIGAIRALREHGLRVPKDVSVVGFDGLPLGAFLNPQLATVRQPVDLIARRSVEILLESIEQRAPARFEIVPFSVWNRESIRPLGE